MNTIHFKLLKLENLIQEKFKMIDSTERYIKENVAPGIEHEKLMNKLELHRRKVFEQVAFLEELKKQAT